MRFLNRAYELQPLRKRGGVALGAMVAAAALWAAKPNGRRPQLTWLFDDPEGTV